MNNKGKIIMASAIAAVLAGVFAVSATHMAYAFTLNQGVGGSGGTGGIAQCFTECGARAIGGDGGPGVFNLHISGVP